MKIRKKNIFKILVSAVLLALIFYGIDFNQLRETLVDMNIFLLIISLLLPFSNRLLMPIKWNLLLKALDIEVSWFRAIKIYYISSFLGLFLPPTIGADAVRAYYVSETNHQLPKIISSIVVERIIGLISLMVFAIIAGFIFLKYFSDFNFDLPKFFTISVLSAVIIICGFLISLSEWFEHHLLNVIKKFTHKKIIGKILTFIQKFYHSYVLYKNKKGTLFLFFILTCLEISLKAVRTYIIAMALNADVPILYYFAFIPIMLLLIRLPISMNGFGIHEGGFIYFLSLMGVSSSLAFSIGIIDHFIFIYAVLPGGIFYAIDKPSISKEIEKEIYMAKQRV